MVWGGRGRRCSGIDEVGGRIGDRMGRWGVVRREMSLGDVAFGIPPSCFGWCYLGDLI